MALAFINHKRKRHSHKPVINNLSIYSVNKKGNMDKVNRIQATQILVFVTCSMFIIAYSVPDRTLLAAQPEDDWVAHPMYISPFAGSPTPIGYNVTQIRTAYNLPSSGGAGTTIAIIDAYDTPNILNYFNTFSSQYNLPINSTGNFLVHKMAQSMLTDSGWAMETCLDVEWAHAIAPNATILLVEAVDNSDTALLAAVDYATSQPGVVAVSMSWGGEEFSSETNFSHENHFNKPGITFFASSGDDGSSVMWPAASASVVSVGGTTLTLNPDGTVISETAWSDSSGGVSEYVTRPVYQTSYGLTYPNRTVPDVSYNGNPNTGVPVYNGTWWQVGGTSAGAPQWAAIHALGLSATNTNLYQKAISAYSSYFRDIISGSNEVYSAEHGYDNVTGLGSPLTVDFGIKALPISGPAGHSLTLSGVGFTAGSSVNISYLNPITSTWISIINNTETPTKTLNYNTTAPDLAQNNTSGDHQAAFNNIIFRAQDNSNGYSYNTSVPYSEMRRGLTQISNTMATGLFGNSTNLAVPVFLQNGQSISVLGNWFSPGTASLFWDNNIALGTAAIDATGFFNATVQVPTTTAGQHRLTINDGSSNFCVNLTRLPTVANDYVAIPGWHTSNVTINLTPDYTVNGTFYKLNNGPTLNATADGQPIITTENSNNTLEYWSTWNVYGAGITDLPHMILMDIKLDETPPAGTITTNPTTSIADITLTLSATDATSGIAQMRFSNDNATWSDWEPYATSQNWMLQSGDGQKTVFAQFMDNAGLASTCSYTLTLETPQPSPTPTLTPPTFTPALTASATPSPTPTASPSPTSTPTPTPSPTPTPTASEIPNIFIILILLTALILVVALTKKRK